MSWIKFHDALCKGDKRGISRAVRFVYLELSLHARAERGFVKLPRGMSDVDAVHDLLSGSRKEVVDALKRLQEGPEPMIAFEGDKEARRLVVLQWAKWNRIDDSAERVRRHRERDEPPDPPVSPAPVTPPVTRYKDVAEPVTTPFRNGGCNAAVTRLDSDSESDQISDPPVVPRRGTGAGAPQVSRPEVQAEAAEAPEAPESIRGAATAAAVFACYLAGWARHVGKGKPPVLDTKRRRAVRARLADFSQADLEAAAAGIWLSQWHLENGQTNFDLAVRDAAHVERFAALGRAALETAEAEAAYVPPPVPPPAAELDAQRRAKAAQSRLQAVPDAQAASGQESAANDPPGPSNGPSPQDLFFAAVARIGGS